MQIKELLQAHLSGEAEEERRAAAAAIESEKRRKAEKVGSILQDIHKKSASDSESEKVKKSNSIKVGTVTGTIKQDVEE